jgi:aspartyl aminopeptidase
MIYTPTFSPIFIAARTRGKYFKKMRKKGYRSFFVKDEKEYKKLIMEIKTAYENKENLGKLNMLSAFGNITDEQEKERQKIMNNKYFT